MNLNNMPEDDNGQLNALEGQQAEVMPTYEEKPAEEMLDELAPEVSGRTKEQFEKLKEANARLAAELEAVKQSSQPKSVLDEVAPTMVAPQQQADQPVDIGQFITDDGTVDVTSFNKAVYEAREQARLAKEESQKALEEVRKFNQNQQVERVHNKYSALAPGSKDFDKNFYELVRNETYGQMMRGENVDFMKAADKVASVYKKSTDVEVAKEQAVSEYKEKIQTRDDASFKSGASQNTLPSNQDELVRQTRLGDRNALYERLKRSGY